MFSREPARCCLRGSSFPDHSAEQPWQEGVCSQSPESLGAVASPGSWRSQVRVQITHGWGENIFQISHISPKCGLLQVISVGCHSSMAMVQCLVVDLQCCPYKCKGWEQVRSRQLLVWTETFPHILLIMWGNAQFWTETPSEFRCFQVWVEEVALSRALQVYMPVLPLRLTWLK